MIVWPWNKELRELTEKVKLQRMIIQNLNNGLVSQRSIIKELKGKK